MRKRRRKPLKPRYSNNNWDWHLGAERDDSDSDTISPNRRDAYEGWEVRLDEDERLIAEAIRHEAMQMAKSILNVREAGSLMQARGMIENFNPDDMDFMADNLGTLQREMLGLLDQKDYSGYSDRDVSVALGTHLNMLRINQGAYPSRPMVGERSRPMDPSTAQVRSMLDRFEQAEDAVFQEASGGDVSARYPMLPMPRVV